MNAAQQLAVWIENEHPQLFRALYSVAQQNSARRALRTAQLRGFADDLSDTVDVSVDTGSLVDPGALSAPAVDDSSFASAALSTPIATDGGSSDSFLSSIGSGIANAASSVGNFLTSPQGLTTLAKLGTAYFQSQGIQAQASAQKAILNTQVAQMQAARSPLPITYMTGSSGQQIPVYAAGAANTPLAVQQAIANGSAQLVRLPDGSYGYTLPNTVLSNLASSVLSDPVVLIGAGLLLILLLRR